ncbi:trimethylamine---corrinoid protein Co-methyltransferase [Candidatus Hakubella thermalkaliphila]|uniref:Trimethylamine---corrinoid protein Co-methyltransferase n=1 Tax=Candidatus Hakubella thermalkaliphila TaxID=2754717 RepID=A0A6V8PU73_9ACTN|nr:trimethylamine methyltransferase family protein [Candidatus Hakubella thermalkaliphila]GFP35827.1 trimethylamine---corrinoid protein Co-methyltransferase [Candidatus Hakubella thermalkaliphila]
MSSGGEYAWVETQTRIRREATTKDLQDAIRDGDALGNINIVGAMARPSEIPLKIRDIYIYAQLIKGTRKPCFAWIHDEASARYVLEIFKVVAGGAMELSHKPRVVAFVEATSPLQYGKESLDVLIQFSKLGLPVGFGPMSMAMATAPVTLAGTVAQENAEILAGIVVSQILHPGMPVVYWGVPHIMDPRTGNISFGSPEQGLMAAAIAQIANYYGLPVGLNVGLTDAKMPDAQAGLEKGMTLIMGALAGADIPGHMGISGADQGASLEQLIIDNEMVGYIKRILRGFEVTENTLAFDVLARVGIGGNFLVDEHTLTHYKSEIWMPRICDRENWESWLTCGGKNMLDNAVEEKERILREHISEPLDDDMQKEIDKIVAVAERELLS